MPVFNFESRIVNGVVSQTENRTRQVLVREDLLAQRRVCMLEAIIGLECSFEPWEPIAKLDVEGLAVGDKVGKNGAMVDVGEFRQGFRGFLGPDHMSGRDPLADIMPGRDSA